MPLYKSADIAAVPFESLLAMDIVPDFRIVIAQEKDGRFDYSEYESRLKEKFSRFHGITEISYDHWVPLSHKWIDMISEGDQFLMVPQDVYMDKDYLIRMWHFMDYDWIDSSVGMHYALFNEKWILYKNKDALTGMSMAFKIPLKRKLIKMGQAKGVDGWLFSAIKPEKKIRLDQYHGEFYIHHFHNLSGSRTSNFINPKHPYYPGENTLPENIKPIINNILWKNKQVMANPATSLSEPLIHPATLQ